MTVILDACAVIAFLRGEAGANVVQQALLRNNCIIHALNLCEVYKDCLVRGENKTLADCYAVALSRRTHGTLFTSDHTELEPLQKLNTCKICFIR